MSTMKVKPKALRSVVRLDGIEMEGERSTKYVFNLEKMRYNHRAMVRLIREDGTISKNQKQIL